MKKLNENDFIIDEIESIELYGEAETIDITVEDTHMFFANDIYTHNSAINESKFDLRVISESLGKAQTADVIIGLGRSDEDKVNKTATLLLLKNRNGQDGIEVPLKFDTSHILISVSYDNPQLSGMAGLNKDSSIEDNYRAIRNNINTEYTQEDTGLDPAEPTF